jgi:hypothetical protein
MFTNNATKHKLATSLVDLEACLAVMEVGNFPGSETTEFELCILLLPNFYLFMRYSFVRWKSAVFLRITLVFQ